ncbi:MAG: glycosyltransferase family 2 protein [Muribaculaceae bacterium]
MPLLSIVILTWNQKDTTLKCLKSLEPTIAHIDTEIIVVDNGSTDGTAKAIEQVMPQAILIKNSLNAGVAAARNQGISKASGKYTLILDNDTIANHSAIDAMLTHLNTHPNTAVVACRLVNADNTTQHSCKPYPGLLIKAANVLGIKIKQQQFPTDSEGVLHPTYVIGACQMIPRQVFDHIGLLDQHIFYGPEDADFCLRATKAGYTIDYLPHHTIQHLHRRTTTHNIFSPLARKHFFALLYFYRKHNRWL